MHKTSYKTLDTKRTRFQEQEKILPILLSRIRNTKLPLFWEVVLDLIELFIRLYEVNNPIVSIFVFSLINVKNSVSNMVYIISISDLVEKYL